ncbi:MAG: hypothetical protein ACREBC_38090 [Pyrinomonadaceae bacterium]
MKRPFLLTLVLVLTVTLSTTCRSESGLFASGDGTPIFEIRRSFFNEVKVFPVLTVVQLHPDNERLPPSREDESKNKVLWKVAADPTVVDKTLVERIERIEYGKVPQGFTQEIPKNEEAPPLVEGQIFEAVGPLSLMRNAVVRFRIADGKVIVVKIPE